MVTFRNARPVPEELRVWLKENAHIDAVSVAGSNPRDGFLAMSAAEESSVWHQEDLYYVTLDMDGFFLQKANIAGPFSLVETGRASSANVRPVFGPNSVKEDEALYFENCPRIVNRLARLDERGPPPPDTVEILDCNKLCWELGHPRSIKALYERLTQEMKDVLYYLNLGVPVGAAGVALSSGLGMFYPGRMDNPEFEQVFFHEAAHLLTGHLLKTDRHFLREWEDIVAGDSGLFGTGFWISATRILNAKCDQQLGCASLDDSGLFPTDYARKNSNEHISELTSLIYVSPDYVKGIISRHETVRHEADFLYKYGYISEEQYKYVTGMTAEISAR